MSSPEDKVKHSRRLKRKTKEKQKKIKVSSAIAKDLRTSKYKMRVVTDKRGKKHDLEKMKFIDLVEIINDDG